MSALRRILGLGDEGCDVRMVQQELNWILPFQRPCPKVFPTWQVLSKRFTPTVWGYFWGTGAYAQAHGDQRLHTGAEGRARRPLWGVPFPMDGISGPKTKAPVRGYHWVPLRLNGIFGPDTKAAVSEYQRLVGIPVNGIVDPETYDHLFPFWKVKVWVPSLPVTQEVDMELTPEEEAAVVRDGAEPARPTLRSPFKKVEFDNIEKQDGRQFAWERGKREDSNVLVLQATWKTLADPREIVPGHWEHTGGAQFAVPLSGGGKSAQFYYQLSRAEFLSFDLTKDLKLTLLSLSVQPYVQVPVDRADRKLVQGGMAFGDTVSLEYNRGQGKPTLKLFLQGQFAGYVDGVGDWHKQWGLLAGVSVQFDRESLRLTPAKAAELPQGKFSLEVQPRELTVRPKGKAAFTIAAEGENIRSDIKVTFRVERSLLSMRNDPPPFVLPNEVPMIVNPTLDGRFKSKLVQSVAVDENATPSEWSISVTGKSDRVESKSSFKLKIP